MFVGPEGRVFVLLMLRSRLEIEVCVFLWCGRLGVTREGFWCMVFRHEGLEVSDEKRWYKM